jgi:ABC-2 type transport system permease protein
MNGLAKQLQVIFNITKTSIKMYFRDKSAVYFSLFIPLLIMSIFGILNLNRSANVSMGVVDEANNQVSKQVVESLKKVDALTISEDTRDAQLDNLKKGKRDLVLILPKDFGSNIAQFQMQKARGVQTVQIQSQNVDVFTSGNKANTNVQIGLTVLDKIFDGFTHQIAGIPNFFTLEQKNVDVKERSYIDFIVPGVAAMSVMQLSIFGVVGAIVSWRERGILKRLLATPIQPSNIIFSQVVTRLIITILQITVLFAVGIYFFKLQVAGSMPLVYFLALLGGVVFLTMGFAVSGFATTQNTVMAVANLIMMPQMFLSGVFFPREALPELMQKITAFFPLTYLSDGMRQVMINGATLYQVRWDLVGLLVWALVVFIAASKFFRWE